MKSIEIAGSIRNELGKKSSKKLRKEGNVPCVIYGKENNTHFFTHENNFLGLVFTDESHIVKLNLEGKVYNIFLKDIQYHPVSDKIEHADFVEIIEDKPIIISIPVRITGESDGIKAGGKLRVKRRHLKVKGFVKDLPEFLPVDITDVKINQSVKVSDLAFDKLEITDPKITTVLTIATSRVAQKAEGEEIAEKPAGEAATAGAAAE